MKGLGLVLALIKKMKTGDDILITETETETAPLRVKVVGAEQSYFVPALTNQVFQ